MKLACIFGAAFDLTFLSLSACLAWNNCNVLFSTYPKCALFVEFVCLRSFYWLYSGSGLNCLAMCLNCFSVHAVEIVRQSSCSMQLTNKTDHYVAFKVTIVQCHFFHAPRYSLAPTGCTVRCKSYISSMVCRSKQPTRSSTACVLILALYYLGQLVMLQVAPKCITTWNNSLMWGNPLIP